jgi:diacylglycerol kinase (ATP)
MRAAAILGLGSSTRDLKPFQHDPKIDWLIGLPAASNEADVVVIFGGDGTVHRHLAQLVKLQLPVLVVPCGSGNDFARALGLRDVRASLSAWREVCEKGPNVRAIDLGVIVPVRSDSEHFAPGLKPISSQDPDAGLKVRSSTAVHAPLGQGTYFCCVGGVGLDGEIARRANRLPRWLRGHGGYAISFPGALVRFAPLQMTILLPSTETSDFAEHRKQPTVVTIFANTPVYGGGMRVAPKALLDDGRLDICLVREVSKLKLLYLFPTVYYGRHLGVAEVEYFQTDRLRLETERPLDVYADGEYVCRTPIEVSVAPRALGVVVSGAQAAGRARS